MPTINSTCDTVMIFSGGDIPEAGAYVAIAGIQLIPSPFINLAVEKYRVGEKIIGGVLKLTLNGIVLGSSFNQVIDGQGANGTGIKDILELAQKKGCVCVEIKCSSTLISGSGRIISVSANEGNQPVWVNMAPYSIEIELTENNIFTDGRIVIPDTEEGDTDNNYVLKNISESLSWSINEDTFSWGKLCDMPGNVEGFGNKHIKVNFNLSASGVDGIADCECSSPSGITPIEKIYGLAAAEKYLKQRLTDLKTKGANSLFDMANYDDTPDTEIMGAFNEYIGGSGYLDFRTIEINPIDNTISLNGEITYRPSGCLYPNVFTTLNIEHNITIDEENITISGNIIGLVDNNIDEIILLSPNNFTDCDYNTKMNNAETFLSQINSPSELTAMAGCYVKKEPFPKGYIDDECEYSSSSGSCVTEATPPPVELCDMRIISSQISRNLSAGEINFSFNLSNSPSCEVLGTTKLDVSITHDKPHDNIVEIIIPGRGSRGPLIQNLCCNSSEKYDINIDATLNKKTCSSDIKKETIEKLRTCAEKELEKLVTEEGIDIGCWFKVNDVESVGTTSYKLSRSYVKPSCP